MFGWSKRCIRWLGILLVAVIAAEARAQAPGSNSKVITWQSPTSGDNYVGIMGEIAKPGVYRLDVQSLTLQSVIRRSGGLLDEASGTIRIVRQDRIVESVFFTPNSNGPLLAGDLLVVESKRTQAAISRSYDLDPQVRAKSANEADAASRSVSTNDVQLAFINVLDHPVVVKVKHEDARLDRIVQKLDHPIELAQAVRVIGSERMLSQSAAPHPIQASLSEGSVLVFPRNAINRNKLPPLPPTYDSRIASGALPSLIGAPAGQSAELRNVGQLPPLMAREAQNSMPYAQPPASLDQATIPSPPPALNPMSPAGSGRVEIPPTSNPMPVVSTPGRIATIPFNGERRIRSSSSQLSTLDGDPPEHAANHKHPAGRAIPGGLDRETSPKEPRSQTRPDDESLEDEDPAVQTGKAAFSLLHMFGIAACVGLLIGLALLTRRYLDRQSTTAPDTIAEIAASQNQHAAAVTESPLEFTTSDPAPVDIDLAPIPAAIAITHNSMIERQESEVRSQQSGAGDQESGVSDQGSDVKSQEPVPADIARATLWFDRLLSNQLVVREEQADFPRHIALQGRIVPPPVYRVDAAISRPLVQGPHFAIESRSDQDALSAESTSVPDVEHVIEDFDDAHGRRPGKPHFLRRQASGHTVAAAAAAATGKVKADSPAATETRHSVTPVADALRHLQGGQS